MLDDVQRSYLELLIQRGALQFGSFTLKSGRQSSYYINTGCFHHASDLRAIGSAYAHVIHQHYGNDVDIIFGPAYKGIPLALAAADAMHTSYAHDVSWAYDRKEAKDHGDGGLFVGAPLSDGKKLVIVDDVLTAGTALRESFAKLQQVDVTVVGAVISIDRMEPGKSDKRASQEIADNFKVPVHSILTIRDAVDYLEQYDVDGRRCIDSQQADQIRARATA